jgi:hypothetical protein
MQANIFFITLARGRSRPVGRLYRDDLGWPTKVIVGQEFNDEVTPSPSPSLPSTAA